ncbi:MAG TPA: hypothetical protein VE869_13950 [Gemmatimonas sp.]|nr:hypothetical protein [Gemmatimonas sp.]
MTPEIRPTADRNTVARSRKPRARPPFEWRKLWRLAGIGALSGATISALLVALWWATPLGLAGVWQGVVLAIQVGVPVGALFGAVLAPTAGLLLLRDVPLWQAVLIPAAGTVIGGSLGLVHSLWFALDAMGPDPFRGALGGFVIGVIGARLVARRVQRTVSE